MRDNETSRELILGGVLGVLLASAAPVQADPPAAKWYDTIALSGYLQGSYVGNLHDPKSQTNTGREFDTDSNSFNLNTFLLQVAKPVGESDNYGFIVRARVGKDANVLRAGQDQANTGKDATFSEIFLQEAYLTYVVPRLPKLSLVGGKFVTAEGVEVADTINNPNFSEGLLFTYAEPVTHTGLKAVYTFNEKINAMLGVANGWDDTSDNNSGKTLLWQVATNPNKQIAWSFQGTYGPELSAPAASERLSLDTVLSYNPDKWSFNAQGNWGQQTDDPKTAASAGTTHWDGLGAWVSYNTTSKLTESVRFEVLADQNGADRFGTGSGLVPVAGLPPAAWKASSGPQTVKEVTLTHKTMLRSNLGTRVEYRYDWSNAPYFENRLGLGVRRQETISADAFVTF
jgi:hypothetical protein